MERSKKLQGDDVMPPPDTPPPEAPRSDGSPPKYSRRLSDKILIAFHHACDQGDYEVAERLLHVLEFMLMRRPTPMEGNRRRTIESLVAAHERLWLLRHPEHQTE